MAYLIVESTMAEDLENAGDEEAALAGLQDDNGAARTRGVPPETLAAAYRVMGRFAWKGSPAAQQDGEDN